MSSLHPVSGEPGEILALLRAWNEADHAEPLVVETSGSTGTAKPVLLSREAMRASAKATEQRLGGPGQWLLALPATYVAGLMVLFRSVVAGTEPILDAGDLAKSARTMAADRRYASLVPTQLARLLETEPEALRGLDRVLVGGARVEPWLRTLAGDAGLTVVATYGMSETCGGCVYDGRPLDGVVVSIDDDQRVRIGGPVLFDGYDGVPRTTDSFLTNDLGRLDDDGTLHVLGRVDDVVITGGVNVATGAVAERLREHPAVDEAEVVGVPDPDWGERVVAVIVGDIDLDEAREWVSVVLPRPWAPRALRTVDEIPLLPNGKVDRQAVEALAR